MGTELAQNVEDGFQQRGRERLGFVQDDDAAREAVKLAAAAGFIGEQAFKELHGGGDDDGGVPIFGGKASSLGGGIESSLSGAARSTPLWCSRTGDGVASSAVSKMAR